MLSLVYVPRSMTLDKLRQNVFTKCDIVVKFTNEVINIYNVCLWSEEYVDKDSNVYQMKSCGLKNQTRFNNLKIILTDDELYAFVQLSRSKDTPIFFPYSKTSKKNVYGTFKIEVTQTDKMRIALYSVGDPNLNPDIEVSDDEYVADQPIWPPNETYDRDMALSYQYDIYDDV